MERFKPMRNDYETVDSHYCTVTPMYPSNSPDLDGKVNEVLGRVRNVEEILVKLNKELASKPSVPPKPKPDRRCSASDVILGE